MDVSEHEAHDIPDATDHHDGTELSPIAKEMTKMTSWDKAMTPEKNNYNLGQGPTKARAESENFYNKK